MTFALTKYIYPLEKELVLSEHLNFTFDNPRTDEEKQLIIRFITSTFEEEAYTGKSIVLPLHQRVGFSIHMLKEELKVTDKDSFVLKHYSGIDKKSVIAILAETWIIVRMKDTEEFKNLIDNTASLITAVYSNKETEYSKLYNELSNYCQLVSLISNNYEKYYGQSFLLLNEPYEIFFTSVNENIYEAVENFTAYNNSFQHESRYPNWLYWVDGVDKVLENASRIDSLMRQDAIREDKKSIRASQKQTPKQKLFHIGRLLKTAYEHFKDPELMLLLQVSIIEYLVTRNPDNNRFNVEDSISKQFKLKCAIIIHSRDKEYDLIKLNNELADIYNQRSDLAHGNYKEEIKVNQIIESVVSLYKFNTHILNVFIDDRNLIDYLKDN